MKKRILALFMVMAMVSVAFIGCGTSAPAAGAGGEINLSIAQSPETIDPQLNSAVDGATYMVHLFEGLMRYKWDATGIEYGTAKSYQVSDDGLVWTFTLRDDAKWSDGKAVTAQDFEYSFKRFVDPATAAPYAADMGKFILNALDILDGKKSVDELGVKAIDEKTFEVTLAAPCTFFAEIMAFPTFSPVRKDVVEGNDKWTLSADTYITNGAFKMESFNLDESLVLVPNEYYYQKSDIKPTKLNWLFLADDAATLSAFYAGDIVFGDGYPQEELQKLKDDGYYGIVTQYGTYYVNFNVTKEPLNNVNVRKALALATDTKYIAETLRNGTVAPAAAIVGPGFKDDKGNDFRSQGKSYIDYNNYEVNKEAAKQALADAGYPNGEGFPKLTYLLNNNTGHMMIAEYLQSVWKEVLNIDIEIEVQDWAVVLPKRRAGDFEITRNGWIADYNDPSTMLDLFTSSSGNNDGKISIPEYDDLMAQVTASNDNAKRMDLMHQAEDVLIGQNWAVLPVYHYADEYICDNNKLKGWTVSPLGYKFFHQAYLAD